MSELKQQLTADMKSAMRAKDKPLLATIRLILAELKRIEVDERIELDDTRVLTVLDKMSKQRKDSLAQYIQADRNDLADIERQELEVIKNYLPQPLNDDELKLIVEQCINETGVSDMSGMGTLMAAIKPKVQGRADMGILSKHVKDSLSK